MNDEELIKEIQKVVLGNPSQVILYNVFVNIMVDMLKDGYTYEDVMEEINRLCEDREEV